jgi:hypothetical protein
MAIICKYCNKEYASYSSRSNHIKKYHISDVNQSQPKVSQVNSHGQPKVSQVNSHGQPKVIPNIIKCSNCEAIFKHKQSKWKHERNCKSTELLLLKEKLVNYEKERKEMEELFIEQINNVKKETLELLNKTCKIHPKTLNKINKQLNINNTLNDTVLYTRSGNFVRDSEGNMVMHNSAYQLSGEGGPITIPARATQLTIERNGNVTVKVDDEVQNLGRIRLVSFINPAGLKRLGDNVYEATEESGDPVEGYPTEDDLGSLLQGFLESSNVNMTSSLFELYQAVRASSFAQRCIEAYSESEKKLLESRSL